ncbi:MAG: GNAT family N-acetyltransferase [Actinomycetota bacterium]|nr:MAG: GNAT family N-acetyltransferase [Actinomycetota bacterium]
MPGLLRVLTARDLDEVRALLARDPVRHCFVASRLASGDLDPWQLGGELWGYVEDDVLQSALYAGANLVPVATSDAARAAFADRCRRIGRRCSSIVGAAAEVLDLWRLLEPAWGPAREVRSRQPLMVCDSAPAVAADPAVRRVREDELDLLVPACVAMFTEEVGVSPLAGGAAAAYRARILELVRTGRAFARIDGDRVVFKAEVGAVGAGACQVQGVWVDPALRGRGLSAPGMARVVQYCRQDIEPLVSLYVNDFNTPARKAYLQVGFREVGDFATVLF